MGVETQIPSGPGICTTPAVQITMLYCTRMDVGAQICTVPVPQGPISVFNCIRVGIRTQIPVPLGPGIPLLSIIPCYIA